MTATLPPLSQPVPTKRLEEIMKEQVPEGMAHTALGRNRYDDMISQNNWDRYGGMPYYPGDAKPKIEYPINDLVIP